MPPAFRRFIITAFLSWLLPTLILAGAGPFGTYLHLSFTDAFAYWGRVIGVAVLISIVLDKAARRFLGEWRSRFHRDLVLIPIFSLLYVGPLYWLTTKWMGGLSAYDVPAMLGMIVATSMALIALRELAIYISDIARVERSIKAEAVEHESAGHGTHLRAQAAALEAGAQTATAEVDEIREEEADGGAEAGTGDAPEAPPNPLYARLRGHEGSVVWSVSGKDHYLDVRSDGGQATVLMRFSDALIALNGLDGIQVHRSHWVADCAVARLRRDGVRMIAVLHDGHEIPVSRTFAAEVRERWKDRLDDEDAA